MVYKQAFPWVSCTSVTYKYLSWL